MLQIRQGLRDGLVFREFVDRNVHFGLRTRVWEPSIVSATKRSATLADRNFAYCSLRSGTLFLIVGLHLALFSGLIMPLSHTHGLAAPSSHRVP